MCLRLVCEFILEFSLELSLENFCIKKKVNFRKEGLKKPEVDPCRRKELFSYMFILSIKNDVCQQKTSLVGGFLKTILKLDLSSTTH